MGSSGPKRCYRHKRRHLRVRSLQALRYVGFICFFVAGQAFAQGQSAEMEIRAVIDGQVAAWNRGDIDGYMHGYWDSDSTVFVSGGTLTKGYAGVLSRYKKGYDTSEKMGRLEFRELRVRLLSPASAVVSGAWALTRKTDKPWGRFTLIVERKPEGWRITHDHTSSAK